MIRLTILFIATCLMSLPAAIPADANESGFTYSRTGIIIQRKSLPALPWQKNPPPSPLDLEVEVREAKALHQPESGWFDLSGPTADRGMLYLMTDQTTISLKRAPYYAPMDVLFMDSQGMVLQVIPQITLTSLEEDIGAQTTFSAFLLLAGGTCAQLSIAPGDSVQHPFFKQRPPVLSATPTTDAP